VRELASLGRAQHCKKRSTAILILEVPEIRDYQRINRAVRQALDAGTNRIQLRGVDGQRLLLHRLRGGWHATIEIDGNAGPELARELDAPGLLVDCLGDVADGAAGALAGGAIFIRGNAGLALGIDQRGGLIVAQGATQARAGLNQRGGVLWLLGSAGPLAGERQQGGILLLSGALVGPLRGHARQGGEIVISPNPQAISAMVKSQGIDMLATELRKVAAQVPDFWRPLLGLGPELRIK
jgi:formylmethanofuran dehydrogenase subunit C